MGDALPFAKPLPTGTNGANATGGAVRDDDGHVVPKQLGDGVFVVPNIFVKGSLDGHLGFFEFEYQPRQAIDKTDHVGATFVHGAFDGELADCHKMIVVGLLPIDDTHPFCHFCTGTWVSE